MVKFKRTDQQEEIVLSEEGILVIEALAGTGKTSSLIEYALERPNKKFRYIAFNSSIVEEAKGKFPKNVNIVTSHGAAFSTVGKDYGNTPNKLVGSIKPNQIIHALKLKQKNVVPEDLLNLFVFRLISGINKFIASEDMVMTSDFFEYDSKSQMEKRYFNPSEMAQLGSRAWDMMCDLNNTDLGMVHDGYLKLYNDLGAPMNDYDYILFDEFQDSSPVSLAIVMQQEQAQKIFVGDSHQAIYGFRGAIDALDRVNADKRLSLTKSFRFGEKVAGVANMLLTVKNSKHYVSGMGGEDDVGSITDNQKHAFIARGNMSILDQAVTLMDKNKRIHFLGGFEGYRFSQLMDVYNLKYNSGYIADPFIKSFKNFNDFQNYVAESMDYDYQARLSMLKKYDRRVPSILALAKKSNSEQNVADVVLMTAHKAKGLEFDSVRLSDDFLTRSPIINEFQQIAPLKEKEEINIAYVAATRARKKLDIGSERSDLKIAYEHEGLRLKSQRLVTACNALSTINQSMKSQGLEQPIKIKKPGQRL